jgi:flagellar FliJ protein
MPRFVFKLEGVLRQRKQIEQQRQRDVAMTQQQIAELQTMLRELNLSLQAGVEDLRTKRLIGKLDLAFIAAQRRFALAMQRKGQGIVQRLALLTRQAETQQKSLIEATKRRKAIDKLKERRMAQWREELERREMTELDEITNQLFFSQRLVDEQTSALEPEGAA